jgi:hypothetical protein
MAQIDPSIALNVKPLQLESPVNQMMAIAQLRGAQQQQQMNALKLQEYQQQEKERNALAQTISRSDFDLNNAAHVQDLLRQAPTLGVPYVKEARMAAAEKARADKEAVQAEHERFKMRKEQLDFTNAALQKSTNPMLARAQIQQAIDLKYVTPEVGVQMLTSVPEDSTEFEAWRSNLLSQSMTAKDQLELTAPKPEKIDLNGVVRYIDLNPRSGTYGKEVLPEMAKTAAPATESDLARLQRERAYIFKENKDDPRLKQYDAAIAKATTTNQPLSDLARKQNELADLEEQLKVDPDNKLLKQRVKEYKDDIRKDTQWKPQTIVMQAPTLSVPAIDMAADRFLTDGTLPTGISKPNRDAIMNRAAAMAKEKGINPDRVAQLEVTANKQALGQLSKTETMVGAFEKNFVKNVKIVENLNKKRDSAGVPLLQKWINVGKKAGTGDPDLAAINVAIKAVVNEYGKIVSGSMGNTAVAVSEIKRMEDLLNAAQNPEDVQAVLNVMRAETQNRMEGFKEQRAELTTSMRSSTTAPAAKPNPPTPYTDAEKERRYQEWKAKQGGK